MLSILTAVALSAPAATIVNQQPRQPTQIVTESGRPADPSYAMLTTRVLSSPTIVDAAVRNASRLKPDESPGLAAGYARFYVEADVLALVRGPNALPARITYLSDVPLDSRGRPPKLKKLRVLLFARPVAGRASEIQLTAPDSQFAWNPDLDARVRGIAREVVASDAPPTITGIGNAFHVPGALPGEGETQIFLTTADNRPVSLSVLHRPQMQPQWAVALAEIVDESAAPPQRDTLLWYRLACGLPRQLPNRSVATLDATEAEAARRDYQFILRSLGSCA